MGLGSGILKKPIPDPGVKKATDPGSGSATLGKSMIIWQVQGQLTNAANRSSKKPLS